MQFGVMASGQMPEALPDPAVFAGIAETVEGLGYDSLWCGDHLSFGNPIIEGMVGLSVFAAYTKTITVGTGVLLLPLRPAGLVAKQIASLDYLTGGRVICGVGVGGDSEKDFELVGVPMAERGRRTDEGIEVMRALWTEDEASFSGPYTRFEDVGLNPMPTQPGGPPIWVAGWADGALRRAGRLGDGWIAYMVTPGRFATNIATVREHAAAAGREPGSAAAALMIPTRIGDDGDAARRELSEHLSRRYHKDYPVELVSKVCLAGNPDEISGRIDEYAAAGVEHLIFLYGGEPGDAESQFGRLRSEVVDRYGRS